jgi:hypothetical protein
MEYEYTNKFVRDLKRYQNNKDLIHIIGQKINLVIKVKSAKEIIELVPIRKTTSRYRIKIKFSKEKVYRIGIVILKNTVWFACIDDNKKRFYKRFP